MDSGVILIFQLIVLIFSVMIHEISHGYIAEYLGDPTARLAGRLTLNPIKHLDFFGTVILPVLTYFAWGFPLGSAKPVPYNPYNLKNPLRGGAFIAVAGPLSNIAIAIIFGILFRIFPPIGNGMPIQVLFTQIIFINLFLAIFNLVPIPPLDGSKVLNFFLPATWQLWLDSFWGKVFNFIRTQWLLSLIIFIFFFQYVLTAVFFLIEPVIKLLYFVVAGNPAGF